MFPDGFWSSPRGRQIARRERSRRTIRIELPGEPWVKGENHAGDRERALREQVAAELSEFGRGTLTGPVAMSLWFWSGRVHPVPPIKA
jgi:hypothetical protein